MRYIAPLLVGIAVLLAACGQDGEDAAARPLLADAENATVEELYGALGESLAERSGVLHIVADGFSQAGVRTDYRSESWVFPGDDLARTELSYQFSGYPDGETPEETSFLDRSVVANGMRFEDTHNGLSSVEFVACFGGSVVTSLLLRCPGPLEDLTKTVEVGRYEGRSVVVLVTSGTSRGADEIAIFTMRLYLDSATLLPIASETSGTFDFGEIEPLSGEESYEHEWVDRGSLPDEFFEPASIGFAE
ncbi:MAG: hypothetical protein IIA90_00610 [Chloroflexi bacterium]|nr:hypothetical protein [Chloroflexota bacterium]